MNPYFAALPAESRGGLFLMLLPLAAACAVLMVPLAALPGLAFTLEALVQSDRVKRLKSLKVGLTCLSVVALWCIGVATWGEAFINTLSVIAVIPTVPLAIVGVIAHFRAEA